MPSCNLYLLLSAVCRPLQLLLRTFSAGSFPKDAATDSDRDLFSLSTRHTPCITTDQPVREHGGRVNEGRKIKQTKISAFSRGVNGAGWNQGIAKWDEVDRFRSIMFNKIW